MDGGDFDEAGFFRSIFGASTRVLLIGRQALIALGLPVLTSDYDLWVHFDDIEQLNEALAPRVQLPTIDDLIATKLFGARQRDLADISLLEALKKARQA